MKALFKLTMIVGILLSSVATIAQPRQGGDRSEFVKARIERMKQAVGLDQKQTEAITKIYTESMAAMASMNSREDMIAANEATNKKIEALLTPDQKKKWAEYQAANPRGGRPQN